MASRALQSMSAMLLALLSGQKKDPHAIDKQIAAMALIRDMTVVTRDQEAFTGIPQLRVRNPFIEAEAT